MKKSLLLFCFLIVSGIFYGQQQEVTATVNPFPFDETEEITITFDGTTINEGQWGVTNNALYLWAWSYDVNDSNEQDSPTNGTWQNSNEANRLTYNSSVDTYTISFVPQTFYNRTGIGRIGFLIKAKDGSGNKQSQDILREVGKFQVNLVSPSEEVTILNAPGSFAIEANSSVTTDFELFANGASVNTQASTGNYTFSYNVTENTDFELVATETGTSNQIFRSFSAYINPTVTEAAVPAGALDGFNFDPANPNSATLVFPAPNKQFVHVIGNFNNNAWTIDNNYLMNYDPATERHWITIDLSNNTQKKLLYQYVIEYDLAVADPYSILILDPRDDQFIEQTVYPDIPQYPAGQTTEAVSFFPLDEPEYTWNSTSFTPPAKEDLVIYEVLLRDFDNNHSYQDLINRLDYLQNLGINAIELMPVQEFDGNNSWGYNPSFHMALDKYYGTRNALKGFIDECHSRGIAVLIDVVYNHATGQNPYFRMYNTTDGGLGGSPSADSPYFNVNATHSYSVFNDFNHSKTYVKDYVKRTATYWIEEFRVDGFRWDLTKGFTQNCTAADESCTNAYQTDRVAVLKDYADAQWTADPDFLIIFEHLGGITEEKEWANYRRNEGKGILFWNKQTNPYNEATMGYPAGSDISSASWKTRGFDNPAAVTYMESHDEERLMYKNLEFGNTNNANHNVQQLPVALNRMKAAGAFFFTVPGPKMIWQFGELGYDISIFTCEDGSVPNNDSCKLAPKPDGWDFLSNSDRLALYETWSKMIELKKSLPIFRTSEFTITGANSNGTKKIQLTDPNATGEAIKYVTVIGNFAVTAQSINPDFQETGTWHNLMDGSTIDVTSTTATITLQPGEFRMYANESTSLGVDDQDLKKTSAILYPNPSKGTFRIAVPVDQLEIYDLNGRLLKKFEGEQLLGNTIDISDFSSGVYLVKTEAGSRIQTTKLIVQ